MIKKFEEYLKTQDELLSYKKATIKLIDKLKHLKTHENLKPKIGEWAIVNLDPNEYTSKDGKMFFNYVTTIPGYVGDPSDNFIEWYILCYENIPSEIKSWFVFNYRAFPPYKIGYHSKNKEDVELHIKSKKYNL